MSHSSPFSSITTTINPLSLQKSTCIYTSCYCEENVYMMLKQVQQQQQQQQQQHDGSKASSTSNFLNSCYAVFMSNPYNKLVLWQQQSSQDQANDFLVIWDYHVILVYKGEHTSMVYDLDTRLPFPCPFDQYMTYACQPNISLKTQYQRYFRVIPASSYLSHFASDRSHMINPQTKQYMSTPPNYPCITTKDCSNNLDLYRFIDPTKGDGPGEICDIIQFINTFQHNKHEHQTASQHT